MHLRDVHHRLSSEERSSRLVDSVTLVCAVAIAVSVSDDCTDGSHYRWCVAILVGRTALYDHLPQPRLLHLRLHHCPSQQKYRASTPWPLLVSCFDHYSLTRYFLTSFLLLPRVIDSASSLNRLHHLRRPPARSKVHLYRRQGHSGTPAWVIFAEWSQPDSLLSSW